MVPVNPEVVEILRRLQAQTLQAGGPFIGMRSNINRTWERICREAGVSDVTMHDLRRAYITRLVRCKVPMAHVQRLAGHTRPETTLRYYTWVSGDELRESVGKLQRSAG